MHAPAGFDPRAPLRVVLFLHGYRGCARVLAAAGPARCRPRDREQPGWDLLARHDEAGARTLLVIAQLALDAREGSPGRLARPGGLRAMLDEILAAIEPELGARRTARELAEVTVVAHSAAFETALALIRGDLPIAHLALLDALYSGGPAFLGWAAADPLRRLVVLHAGAGTTGQRSRELARRARRALGAGAIETDDLARVLPEHRVAVVRVRTAHGDFPRAHLAAVIRHLVR